MYYTHIYIYECIFIYLFICLFIYEIIYEQYVCVDIES
jgi:hypothetical protein